MSSSTDHPLWAPFRDLRAAGRRVMGGREVFIAEGRILVEDLLRAGRAGQLVVHSVATTPALAEQLRPQLPSSAVLLAWESTRPGADDRRSLIARCVLVHRLSPRDPLAPDAAAWEVPAADWVLGEKPASLDQIAGLLAS